MNNKKSMLKCILASAVAVSSLGTLASAQDMSAPCINEDVSKKLSSPFEQTPFLVKAKSIAKGTRVVLAKKKSTPTGAAANIPDNLTSKTSRTNQTTGSLSSDRTNYNNIKYSSSWSLLSPAPTLGGAIHSEVNTTITNSIFRNNEAEGRYIIRSNPSYGGGMYIEGNRITATIDNVLFDSNTASSGSGGAIYSAGGDSNDNVLTFNITNATFTNNSATELNNNHGDGGAIYSNGYTSLTITDTDFTSNSAEGDGGAIYNNANNVMSIVASGSDVNFSGNSASGNGGAIYNASGKTINFSTSNDKTINFLTSSDNDIYNVGTITINGDVKVETNISGNGTLNLNSGTFYAKQLSQGRLNLNGGTLSFQESDAKTQNLPVAYSSSSVTTLSGSGNLKIDVNMANGSSDTLSVNSANAGTTLNLSSINVGADYAGSYDSLVDYISYVTGRGRNNITYTINGSSTGQLVTQSSTGVSYTFTLGSNGKLTVGDIHETDEGLKEFIRGTLTTNTDNFSFTDDLQLDYDEAVGTTDNSTYTTLNMEMNGHNLTGEELDGITVADGYTLNVNGQAGTPSVISNFAKAFVNEGILNVANITFNDDNVAIDNSNELNLSGNNTFQSAVSGSGSTSIDDGVTTIGSGVNFTQGEITVQDGAQLLNSGNVTVSDKFDNFGTVQGGTITLDSAEFNLKNGGSLSTSAFTTTGSTSSTLNALNNAIDNIVLGNTTLSANLNTKIDINQDTGTFDTISINAPSSGTSGNIYINNINFLGSSELTKDSKFKILTGANGTVQLESASSLADDIVEVTTAEWDDDIIANIKWDKEFNHNEQEYTDTYKFGAVKSAGSEYNDSLGYSLDSHEGGEITSTSLGDTLKILNQFETNTDRSFTANSASDIYNVGENLGATASGKLVINGLPGGATSGQSTINGQGHSLFELTNANTQVEINNTQILNAVHVATVGADNALTLNNVIISGSTDKAITSSGAMSVHDSAFINNTSADDGGAIYLSKIPGTTEFKNVLFQGNTIETNTANNNGFCGGVIYINAAEATGTNPTDSVYSFDNVTFDSNGITNSQSTGRGGAIYIMEPTTDKNNVVEIKNSSFVNNYLNIKANGKFASGGAIYNNGKISKISGTTFEGNYASAYSNISYGGALCNNKDAVISSIEDTVFTGNRAGGNEGRGGAVQNSGSITFNGTNTFTNNTANASSKGFGGAIYNDSAIVFNGTTTFTGNSVTANSGDGGAIYNGFADSNNNKNVILTFNGTATFSENKVNGVLNDIYNKGVINFGANSTTTLNGGANGDNGTMNMASGAVLNLGGVISDNTIKMSGGTINLGTYTPVGSSDVNYGNLNLIGLTTTSGTNIINAINDSIQNIGLGTATLTAGLNANLDITSTGIDHFTVTDGSTGTISVTLSDVTAPVLNTVYQVIYGDDSNQVSISLASAVADYVYSWTDYDLEDSVYAVHNWGDVRGIYNQDEADTYHFEVVDNNHSLAYVIDESMHYVGDKEYTTYYDLLHRINTPETDSDREFNASSATETYTVGANIDPQKGESITGLGTTSRGKLTINGVAEGNSKSTIDGNGKTLFELTLAKDGDTNTQVIINNTKIINAAKVATVSADNELTLNNVEISGNTSGITNNGDLIFTGNNTIANVIDGNNGAASVNSGITTLSADLTQGTLDVLDSAQIVNNANIRATVTNAGTITNNSAIYTLNGSNSGTISGGRLNISGTFDNSGVLSNSVVNVENSSQLNYATNSANASFSSTLVGSNTAKFNKSGSTELQISGNQSGFEGTVNINEGALTYLESSDNRFFDSSAIINVDNTANADSTLKYTSISGKTLTNGVLPAINLKNGATFEYNAGTGETVIGNGFYNSVSGSNNLIFNGGNSDRVVLNSDFNSNDTATFKGANLVLGSGLSTIASSIILDNTSLNLMNSSVADYTINGLSSLNNSKVNVDVSLGAVSAGDRLLVENGSGVLNISQFRIVDDNGLFTTDDSSKTVQIIKNGSNSSLSLGSAGATIDGAWSTNVYEYQISSAKTDTDNDSLKFTGVDVSDANSLKKMNNYDNSTEQNIRGFSVVRGASPYHIGEDLGKTEHGTFVVNGVSKDESVISGVRAEGDWTSAGEKGSMFELTETEKTTDFNLSNVTVEDAQVSSRGGAVVYSTSDKADITISDVIIQNNTSSGRGGAFDIENAHSVSISNSEFKGNASDGLGGAIYSAVDLSVSNTDFSNNTAQNSANDIYLANGADLLYTTGAQANTISGGISSEISQSVFTKLGSSDLNISGSNSGYKGSVNINEGNLNFVATSAQDSLFDTSDSSINIAQNSKFNIDDKGLTNLATSNLNGKGTIDKNGAGVLNVTGDNDNFIGVVNIKSGEISYKEQGEGASFFDASAINMSANTVLSVETTSQNNIQGGNISSSGSGTVFNKSGSGSFDLTGKNTVGSVNVQQGILNVADNAAGTRTYNAGATSISENATLNYTVDKNSELTNLSGNGNLVKQGGSKLELSDYTFSGLAQVQNGILDVTSSSENATDLDFNVEVYGNSEFDYNAGTNAQLTLNNKGKFAFDTDASGAKAVFNNAKINLGEIANVAGNTVVINNSSEIALTASNYLGSYEFTNSVLDVMDSDVSLTDALKTYTFNNLTVNNSDLTIDVSLGNNSGSDVLNIVDGSGNLRLTKLAITEDNGIFDNEEKTKTFQIINNTNGSVGISLLAGDPKLADWSTTIYEYEINAVKSDDQNDYYDSVEFKGIRIASPDTLRIMNHERNGSRGFSVVGSNIYHIARDLDETLEGDFVVIGNGKDVSTISGNRVSYTRKDDGTIDISAPIEGEYGSFFELTKNNTKLTVQDLTIQEAQRKDQAIKDGSVLYLNNGKSEAVLNNVVFKDSSAANGGAIANINSKSLAITNSDFTGNSASANGGVIYNTSTGTSLTNITADGNKADGKGGAIYTNADMLITNSAFGANSINQHKNGNDEYAANDIYIDGENAKVTFNATGNSSLINSGIAGNGTLEKTGDGVLNLHGNNADFGGVLKVSNGEVLFSQNSANDTYITGTTNVANGAKVTLDNDAADISGGKFAGNGEISQTGSKNIILTEDNSGFHGSANITGGNLVVNDNSFFASDSNTTISNVIEFNTSSGKEISINNDGDLISGSGSLRKSGAGKLILSGNNSALTGGTLIQAGTLEYDASGNNTDSMVGGGINVNGNTFIVKNTANSIFDLNNDISGNGTFNVKGKVSISGDDSQYTGTTNILSDSVLSFEKTDDNSFVGGLVNAVGNLEYTTSKTNQDVIQNVIGSGNVSKLGSGNLVINNTVNGNDRFTGLFDAINGTLTINAQAQAQEGVFDYSAVVSNGSVLNYNSSANDNYSINGNSKFGYTGTGNQINFANGTYNLSADLTNAVGNTTSFKDAVVNSYGTVSFNGDYALNGSSLNTNNGAINTLTFNQLSTTNDNNLNIDFSFGANASDQIVSTNQGGSLILNAINVFNITDDGTKLTRNVQVLDGLTFANPANYQTELISDLYKYTTTIVDGTTLHLVASDYATADTLYILNHVKDGTRTFQLVGDSKNYYSNKDLEQTLAGTLNINGRTQDRADTIIARTSAQEDARHSMFNLVNANTKLNIKDITIQDAQTADNGSVINATNSSAQVSVQNTTITSNNAANGGAVYSNAIASFENDTFNQNSATSNGGAINNYGDNLTVSNSVFSLNTAAAGGALYNTGKATVSGLTEFNQNKAANGGAIYNSGEITVGNGVSFSANGLANSEGSAIYNIGTATLTNTTFTDNIGNSYIYNGSDGILSIIAEKVGNNKTDLVLDNSTDAIIKNNGVMNLTSNDLSSLTVNDEINSTSDSNKGRINTQGKVALNDFVRNQTIEVKSGLLTVGAENSAVADALQNVDLIVDANTQAIINNKNIVGGTIQNNSRLDIANSANTAISAQLSGTGNINKSGDGKVTFNGERDNSNYSGTINVEEGTVSFETNGANFISKDATVKLKENSTFEYNTTDTNYTFSDNTFANVMLNGEGSSFIINGQGAGNSKFTLNSDWVNSNEYTHNLIFKNADYVLNSTFAKAQGAEADNIKFDSSTVTIGSAIEATASATHPGANDYNLGTNNYNISNSYLDLSNKIAGDNYNFDSLDFSNGSTFSMDVNLVLDTATGKTPYGDTITASSGDGVVKLTKLFITDDNGMFDSNNEKGIIQVFKGDNNLQVATQDDMSILSWATNVYKYGVTSARTDHEADSIKIAAKGISSTDTLRDLNRYQLADGGGNRGFSFIAKDGKQEYNVYNIYRDLDTTSAQNFAVVGTISTDEGKKSVLDGTLKPLELLQSDSASLVHNPDGSWTYEGVNIPAEYVEEITITTIDGTQEPGYRINIRAFTPEGQTQGSMFELVNNTKFEMTNVSVENAKRYSTDTIKDGSVIYANNADATVTLNNVDFKNNSVDGGNGGAVANLSSSSFYLVGSEITGNSAKGNGGAIYNTSSGETVLQNINAYSNTSTNGLGGAIYTNADMIISDSRFGVDSQGNASLNRDRNGQNDIYIDGSASVIFNTTDAVESSINSGVAGSGNLIKTGSGVLNLGGTNDALTGTLAITAGTVNYTADDANDTFVGGSVQIAENSQLVMNISNGENIQTQSLNNVNGYTNSENIKTSGSIVKTGDGTLQVGGNNSGFTGTTTIKSGTIEYIADESTDRYLGGSTVIGNTQTQGQSANLVLNISEGVANQVLTNVSSATQSVNANEKITKTGKGSVVVTGDNSSFYGQTDINNGSLIYKPENTTDKYFSGNTVIGANGTLETQVAKATAEGASLANQTIGNISGTGNFVVNNEYTNANTQGRIQLVGTNDFEGLTDIKSGILAYVNDNGDFVSGDVQIEQKGTLEYTTNEDGSISNTITSNGTFDKLGDKKLSLTGDASGFEGVTNIKEGTLSYDDSVTGAKFVGGNVNITGILEYIASARDEELSNNLSGTGVFNKSGEKTVTITGNNSGFTGTTNINQGTLAYSNASGEFVGGDVNVTGTLDYTTGANTSDNLTNKITGTGKVVKNGAGELVINNTVNGNNRYTGEFDVNAGTLTINAQEQAQSGVFDYSAVVSNGSVLNYNSSANDNYSINGNSKFGYTGTGNQINFANGTYNLSADLANAVGNTTSFKDAVVNSYGTTSFSGNYTLNGSSLNTDNGVINTLTFNQLSTTNDNNLNIDFSFGANASDQIVSTNQGGSLILNAINVFNTTDDGTKLTRNVQVLDGLTFANSDYQTELMSDLYKYTVTIVDGTTLHLVASDYATADSLYILNHQKSGERTFQLVGDGTNYYSNKDLEQTLAGTLNIKGRSEDRADTIIARTSAQEDARHSMFNLAYDDTSLNISDITIQDAQTAGNGSVINATNSSAQISIDNTLIKNSNASGNGGAIYSAADLTIKNSDFENNTATVKGNDIYLAGGADVSFETGANGNRLTGGIASETNASNFTKTGTGALNLSGKNSDYLGTVDIQNGNLNYDASSANDSFFSNAKEIKVAEESKLNIDDKGLTNLAVSNLSGKGELNKNGSKTLTLTRDNSQFNGDTNINSGKLAFDNAGDNKFVGGDVLVRGTLEYTASQNAALNNAITGNGTFDKQGTGTLSITGDESAFSGKVDINAGTIAYDTASGGKLFGSSSTYEISDGASLDLTANGEDETIAIQNVSSQGSNNTAAINKNGAGTLELNGNNSSFRGDLNINSGKVAYENKSGNAYIAGDTAISQGAALDYTATTNGTLAKVSGSGDLNKLGSGELVFNETENTFSGSANVQAGKLTVNGSANATDFAFNTTVTNGSFEYNAGEGSTLTIGGTNSKFSFDQGASGSATFNGKGATDTTYNLGAVANMNDNTSVTLSNSTIKLTDDNYNSGNYIINNSIIDLINDAASDEKSFGNLTINGTTKLKIDVDLGPLSGKPYSDVLNVNNGSGTLLIVLDEINVLNAENNNDDGNHPTYVFDVITGDSGLVLDAENSVTKWATNVYEYDVDINNDKTGIKMTASKAADEHSLKAMNDYEGKRGFQFTDNDDDPYIIGEDLGETAKGEFKVIGTGDTVVSGENKQGEADKSFFEVVKDTDLEVKNLTITKAAGDEGSVLVANNENATVAFDNVDITNSKSTGDGGAINNKESESLTLKDGTASGNSAGDDDNVSDGGFMNNSSSGETSLDNMNINNNSATGNGGAINNSGSGDMTVEDSSFGGNSAGGAGGAINNGGSGDLTVSNTTFHDNTSKGNGGALNNTSTGTTKLDNITAYNNTSEEGLGGAIYTNQDMTITDSSFGVDPQGNPSLNRDKNGQNDIYIADGATVTLETKNSDSTINSGVAGEGDIDKTGSKTLNLSGDNDGFTGDLNVKEGEVKFTQNSEDDTYVSGPTNISGGAKVTLDNDKSDITAGSFSGEGDLVKDGSKDLTLTGDNSGFSGKVDIQAGSVIFNADDGTKYFGGQTNIGEDGELVVNSDNGTSLSQISGNGTMTKNGDGDLTLNGNNSGFNGDMNINGGALNLASGTTLGNIGNATFADGTAINLQNTSVVTDPETGAYTTDPNPASIESLSFNNLVINGKVDFKIDVDLYNEKADNIHADQVTVNNDGYLSIGRGGLNVVTDAKSLVRDTIVQIASGALAQDDYIRLESDARTVMGPIQKYDVTYGNGNLTFAGQGGDRPDINSVNPAIMASPVATQIGGFLTQSQMLQDGFFHMNRYTKYAHSDRFAAENINKYAIETGQMPAQASPLPETSQGMWIKPYATYEKVGLRNGYKVENFAYGSMYGGDGDMFDMGHGWKGVISAFVGYNGNHMNYNGISMDMQGGSLGATGTFYKGNFFTGITVSTGASAGEAYTQYGTDRFSMLTAGIANKTGYNIEINDGKLIVQPTLFTGYTFVNTFDYTNAAGVRMDSDPLHAIQIIPGVKIIGNLENGWQPYAGVDMVWNIMDRTNVMANDVRLPQMSVKPYVQYGVGVQKSWGDKFTAFVQTMFRGGGRNGVAFTAGFRWVFGKEKKKVDPNYVPVKKVIKKL